MIEHINNCSLFKNFDSNRGIVKYIYRDSIQRGKTGNRSQALFICSDLLKSISPSPNS